MRTEVGEHTLTVHREVGDPRMPTESAFWHALKKHLNAQDHDLVKKIMCKDGHMYGDEHGPYYLRDRRWSYCITDPSYAIRALHKAYNAGQMVELVVSHWER